MPNDTPHDAAERVLAAVQSGIEARFAGEAHRASVSFVGVDPITVLRFGQPDGGAEYVSLGMSRAPMTAADADITATEGPRAELVLGARLGADAVWSKLAILAAAPAVEGVVYRPDMTVDLGTPLIDGSTCTGVIVGTGVGEAIATPAGEVELLRVQPATANELAWCRVHGAAALRERWTDQDVDLHDLRRAGADLN